MFSKSVAAINTGRRPLYDVAGFDSIKTEEKAVGLTKTHNTSGEHFSEFLQLDICDVGVNCRYPHTVRGAGYLRRCLRVDW